MYANDTQLSLSFKPEDASALVEINKNLDDTLTALKAIQ